MGRPVVAKLWLFVFMLCLLEILESKFDIIVLTEIGARNLSETESLFIGFSYRNAEYVSGGVYRHPNDNTKYVVYDLETTLEKIRDKVTVILAAT